MSKTIPPLSGKYRMLRPLAQGGMGKIWVAEHLELGTEVAIKRLELHGNRTDPGARFRREAMTLAQLRSRHIVHVYDFGGDEEGPYIVMELLQGEDLSQALARDGGMQVGAALAILEQVGKALMIAHGAGIIHRDIKPSNVFLAREAGEDVAVVKVLDFGIAKQIAFDSKSETLTGTGHVIGSPAYMSPEQVRGKQVDVRTDVWGVTALYYELLTGQTAFALEHQGDLLFNICQGDFIPLSVYRPELEFMTSFFRRGLASHPEDRFPSIQALLDAARKLAPPGARLPEGSVRANEERTLASAPSPRHLAASDRTKTLDALTGETSEPSLAVVRRSRARSWVGALGLTGVIACAAFAHFWLRTGEEKAPPSAPEPAENAAPQSATLEEASNPASSAEEPGVAPAASATELGSSPSPNAGREASVSEPVPASPRPRSTPVSQPSPSKRTPKKSSEPRGSSEPKTLQVDSFTGLPLSSRPPGSAAPVPDEASSASPKAP